MGESAAADDDALLDCLLDGTESTALVVEMLAKDRIDAEPEVVQAALEHLAEQTFVVGHVEPHHAQPGVTDTWWALTALGWLKYATERPHTVEDDPLGGDHPPMQRALAHLLTGGDATDTELTEAVIERNGRLPPDEDTLYRSLQDPDDGQRTLIAERVTRALGRLATSGIVSGTPLGGGKVRWHLTRQGTSTLHGR